MVFHAYRGGLEALKVLSISLYTTNSWGPVSRNLLQATCQMQYSANIFSEILNGHLVISL